MSTYIIVVHYHKSPPHMMCLTAKRKIITKQKTFMPVNSFFFMPFSMTFKGKYFSRKSDSCIHPVLCV